MRAGLRIHSLAVAMVLVLPAPSPAATAPSADATGGTAAGAAPAAPATPSRPASPASTANSGGSLCCRAARPVPAPRAPARTTPARPAPAPRLPATTTPAADGRFPVAGPHTYGGAGSRFGAPRSGHAHGGQDISAAEGTPVVAPRAATVIARGFAAVGAGNYLVLAGATDNRSYVFMHLQTASLLVERGMRVAMGQTIARVGNTGTSFGAHLHFEIWEGCWFGGGRRIDPLPDLQRWDRTS